MGYPTASLNSERRQVSSRTPQPEKPKFSGFEELLYLREAASLLGMLAAIWGVIGLGECLDHLAAAESVPLNAPQARNESQIRFGFYTCRSATLALLALAE